MTIWERLFGQLRTNGTARFWAVLSGAALFLSFPKYGIGQVAWVALIPLFWAIRDKRPAEAFRLGLLAGFVGYVGLMYWIAYVVVQYGYLPWMVGIAVMLLLVVYLSLYMALFAAASTELVRRGVMLPLAAPVCWVVLEYVKSSILTGFPWANLGHSQHAFLEMLQLADLTGVYGLSFLIVLANALMFTLERRVHCWRRQDTAAAMIGVGLFFLTWGYGFYRIAQVDVQAESGQALEISLIQGNVDQSVKWNPLYQKATMDAYLGLSRTSAPARRGLIVWPETAIPGFFQDVDDMHRQVVGLAQELRAWMLVGSPSYRKAGEALTLYNSAFLLRPDGTVAARYDKNHLVPYGEYVPLRTVFPFITKLAHGIGDFGTGNGFIPLDLMGFKVGVLICYEGIFADMGREYRNNGAELLLNITNDAWFGQTSAPYQHLAMTVFRAVENRLYLARAANTGISALVTPTGKILAATGLFESAGVKGKIRFMKEHTFYTRFGDIFVYLCIAALAGCILFVTLRRKP